MLCPYKIIFLLFKEDQERSELCDYKVKKRKEDYLGSTKRTSAKGARSGLIYQTQFAELCISH